MHTQSYIWNHLYLHHIFIARHEGTFFSAGNITSCAKHIFTLKCSCILKHTISISLLYIKTHLVCGLHFHHNDCEKKRILNTNSGHSRTVKYERWLLWLHAEILQTTFVFRLCSPAKHDGNCCSNGKNIRLTFSGLLI